MSAATALRSNSMIAGTGARLVVEHLERLQAEAANALVGAPAHMWFFERCCTAWIKKASGDLKNEINNNYERGIDVVAHFGRPLPSPSSMRISSEQARERARLLQQNDWLIPVGTGFYRPASGAVFGANPQGPRP